MRSICDDYRRFKLYRAIYGSNGREGRGEQRGDHFFYFVSDAELVQHCAVVSSYPGLGESYRVKVIFATATYDPFDFVMSRAYSTLVLACTTPGLSRWSLTSRRLYTFETLTMNLAWLHCVCKRSIQFPSWAGNVRLVGFKGGNVPPCFFWRIWTDMYVEVRILIW